MIIHKREKGGPFCSVWVHSESFVGDSKRCRGQCGSGCSFRVEMRESENNLVIGHYSVVRIA